MTKKYVYTVCLIADNLDELKKVAADLNAKPSIMAHEIGYQEAELKAALMLVAKLTETHNRKPRSPVQTILNLGNPI